MRYTDCVSFLTAHFMTVFSQLSYESDELADAAFMRLVVQHTFSAQPQGASRVLAMMPKSQLEDVLVQHPDWKTHLRDFVGRQPPSSIPPHVRQLLT